MDSSAQLSFDMCKCPSRQTIFSPVEFFKKMPGKHRSGVDEADD